MSRRTSVEASMMDTSLPLSVWVRRMMWSPVRSQKAGDHRALS